MRVIALQIHCILHLVVEAAVAVAVVVAAVAQASASFNTILIVTNTSAFSEECLVMGRSSSISYTAPSLIRGRRNDGCCLGCSQRGGTRPCTGAQCYTRGFPIGRFGRDFRTFAPQGAGISRKVPNHQAIWILGFWLRTSLRFCWLCWV